MVNQTATLPKNYTHEEVYNECLKYFNGDIPCANVMVEKYLLRDDSDRNQEKFLEKSPEDLFERISTEFERIEKKYPNPLSKKEILKLINGFKYIIPQGSPLFGIGNNLQITSLSNCFVIEPPMDSYGGILKSDEELAQIMKRRGGVGIDMSTIRPRGTQVKNAARSSDGLECFMERFSNTTKEVAQNGRRGALMLSMDCRHPDLENFINVKKNKKKVTAANISVRWTDDFMQAVETNSEYTLRFPVNASLEKATFTRVVNARKVWENFIQANWESAEPGCLFFDTIINNSIPDCYENYKTVSTNPCGEIPLNSYGSCILMSLNVSSFVKKIFEIDAEFDFNLFKDCIGKAIHLVDDIIDLELEKIDKILAKIESDPEPADIKDREQKLWKKIRNTLERGRRIGLGITGLGDALAYCNFKYGSPESIKLTEQIFKIFNETAFEQSVILANDRGVFPEFDWNKEKNCTLIKNLPQEILKQMEKYGRRNISLTTMAPAGTISIMAKVTSGIEPMIYRSYKRYRKLTQEELDRGAKVERTDNDGIKWTVSDIEHHGLSLWKQKNPGKNIKDSPYWGCEAGEIDWKLRIRMQATVQKYITHSISSTCNIASSVTQEQVSAMYIQAWKEGLKGFTIYRDGTRDGVMISDKTNSTNIIVDNHAPKRPEILECEIHYSTIDNIQWIFFVSLLNKRPYEIFGGKRNKVDLPKKFKTGWIKKDGKPENRRLYDLYLGSIEDTDERMIIKDIAASFSSAAGSYTRIISTMLRHGTPIKFVCETLNKDNEANMFCLERAVSRILKKYIKDGEIAGGMCEKCGSKLNYKDGCVICLSCGWSKCN